MSGRRSGALRPAFRFGAGRRPRMPNGLTGSSSLAKHRCLREAAVQTTPHNTFNVKRADGTSIPEHFHHGCSETSRHTQRMSVSSVRRFCLTPLEPRLVVIPCSSCRRPRVAIMEPLSMQYMGAGAWLIPPR